MEILCTNCGHSLKRHTKIVGCEFGWEKGDDKNACRCNLSPEMVETRYWRDFYQKETYRLREEFIADDRCPYCLGDLRKEEVGLPDDTVSFVYHCCSCNKVWTYYGKDLTSE